MSYRTLKSITHESSCTFGKNNPKFEDLFDIGELDRCRNTTK